MSSTTSSITMGLSVETSMPEEMDTSIMSKSAAFISPALPRSPTFLPKHLKKPPKVSMFVQYVEKHFFFWGG